MSTRDPKINPEIMDVWRHGDRTYKVVDLDPLTIRYEDEPQVLRVVARLGGTFVAGDGVVGDLDGRKEAPYRYVGAKGRETIDYIRDSFREIYGEAEGDRMFAAGCLFQVFRYSDRVGKKEGQTAERDREAARWYTRMHQHVLGLGPDPREVRGDAYMPYVYHPTLADWTGLR